MKTYLCRHALLLWLELRGRRAEPDHEDLDPYRLAPILASRFVLDVAATGSGLKSVETGTRVSARLPSFSQSPRSAFGGIDGAAFEEFVRIVAQEGHGAVIHARANEVALEILLMPLTLHRFSGRRVLGVVADCNPYAKPGAALPLVIESCRFLSKDLPEIAPQSTHLRDPKNRTLTATDHSRPIAFAHEPQRLTSKFHPRLLQ